MTVLVGIVIVCLAGLYAQHRAYRHDEMKHGNAEMLRYLAERVKHLENLKEKQYNHAAFEELKNKVEALRLVQGLKGPR